MTREQTIHCPTCGSVTPANRHECDTCGSPLRARVPAPLGTRLHRTGSRGGQVLELPRCPRCGYQGEGIGYFSQGSRIALLVIVTMFTMAAMGAGGLVYYFLRRDHRVCPRCGAGWGSEGELALPVGDPGGDHLPVPLTEGGSTKNGWSVLLFLLAAFFLIGGVMGAEPALILLALGGAGGGYWLRRAAGRDRERRREALISSLQLPVLKLAADQGGRLTVSEVAAHLGWPIRRAEKVLYSLDDGIRVDSRVTDEGVIIYEFRELLPRLPDDRG